MEDAAAEHVRGGGLGLLEGVVDRLEADAPAVARARVAGTVADGVDVRIARTAVLVHGDAVVAGEPGVNRQLAVGHDADAHDHEPGGHARAIVAHDARDPPFALDGADRGPEADVDAMSDMLRVVEGAHLGRHHPAHDAIRHLEHRDCEARLGTGGRALEADVARADDGDSLGAGQFGADRIDVGLGAQVMDASEPGARNGERAGAAAGGEQQPVVGQGGAVVECHQAPAAVDRRRPSAESQLAVLLLIERHRADPQPVGVELARQVLLRQRRALVGKLRLVTHQHQAPAEAVAPQAVDGLRRGMARADDHDSLGQLLHPSRQAGRAPAVAREGSGRAGSAPARRAAPIGVRHDGARHPAAIVQVPDFN